MRSFLFLSTAVMIAVYLARLGESCGSSSKAVLLALGDTEFDGPMCDGKYRCKNGGTCVKDEECLCTSGWQGQYCEIPYCEEDCVNGGNCIDPDTCNCTEGYTGTDCSAVITDTCYASTTTRNSFGETSSMFNCWGGCHPYQTVILKECHPDLVEELNDFNRCVNRETGHVACRPIYPSLQLTGECNEAETLVSTVSTGIYNCLEDEGWCICRKDRNSLCRNLIVHDLKCCYDTGEIQIPDDGTFFATEDFCNSAIPE